MKTDNKYTFKQEYYDIVGQYIVNY